MRRAVHVVPAHPRSRLERLLLAWVAAAWLARWLLVVLAAGLIGALLLTTASCASRVEFALGRAKVSSESGPDGESSEVSASVRGVELLEASDTPIDAIAELIASLPPGLADQLTRYLLQDGDLSAEEQVRLLAAVPVPVAYRALHGMGPEE